MVQAFSITISIGSGLLNHYLSCIRPSQSRLYRPTDSFEDLSIVTTDLQSSLGREKEDKLINIKNIVIKHSESADFSAFIDEMREEVENMPGDLAPSKIVHDEKRLDRVLK